MTPEFSQLVDPIFLKVLDLLRRLEQGERCDLQLERSLIRNLIDDAERSAATPRSQVALPDFVIAKEAIVYWADEVLTLVAPDWKNILLEREYYGSRDRAWKFYVEGELQGRHANPDVAETYYLALVLGFVGDIRDAFKNHLNREMPGGTGDPDEARTAWARQLEQRIHESASAELTGEALDGHVAPLQGRTLLRFAAVVFGVVLVASIIGWLVVVSKLNQNTNEVQLSAESATIV